MSNSWTSQHFHPYHWEPGENDKIANLEESLWSACMEKDAKVKESEATILQGLLEMMGWVIISNLLMLLFESILYASHLCTTSSVYAIPSKNFWVSPALIHRYKWFLINPKKETTTGLNAKNSSSNSSRRTATTLSSRWACIAIC